MYLVEGIKVDGYQPSGSDKGDMLRLIGLFAEDDSWVCMMELDILAVPTIAV